MASKTVADLSDNETPVLTEQERKELISNKGLSEGIASLTGKGIKKDVSTVLPKEQEVDWDEQIRQEEEEREREAARLQEEEKKKDDESDEASSDEDDSSDDDESGSESEDEDEGDKSAKKKARPSSGDVATALADMSDLITTLMKSVEAQDKVVKTLTKKVKKQENIIVELQGQLRIEKNNNVSAIDALKTNLTKRIDDVADSMAQVPPLVDRLQQSSAALFEKLPADIQATVTKVELTAGEKETVKAIRRQVGKKDEFKIPRWLKQ